MSIDIMPPTLERLRKIKTDVESPVTDQKRKRNAWRIVPLPETMFKTGRISRNCYDAYERFEKDWDRAQFTPSCIAKYGQGFASGTPVAQMLDEAMQRAEVRDVRRVAAIDRTAHAFAAIGTPSGQRAVYMLVSQDVTLEEIGRECSGYLGKMQALAAGTTVIRESLYRLFLHYDEG